MSRRQTEPLVLARPVTADGRNVSALYVWVRGITGPQPVQHTMVLGSGPDETGCGKIIPMSAHDWHLVLPQNLSERVRRCRVCFP